MPRMAPLTASSALARCVLVLVFARVCQNQLSLTGSPLSPSQFFASAEMGGEEEGDQQPNFMDQDPLKDYGAPPTPRSQAKCACLVPGSGLARPIILSSDSLCLGSRSRPNG
eukprot:617835-Rhodomonas_salina.3